MERLYRDGDFEFEMPNPTQKIQDTIVREISRVTDTSRDAVIYKRGLLFGMLRSLVLTNVITREEHDELMWKIWEIIEPSNSES